MKEFIRLLFIFLSFSAFAQDHTSINPEIEPAPAEKSVVYFIRSSITGFAINFTYFDSAHAIGKYNAPYYLRYTCTPGHHLFWARSENKDFIEAELLPGKIYFIKVIPQIGIIKAGVKLRAIDPRTSREMKKIKRFILKHQYKDLSSEELHKIDMNLKEAISYSLNYYQERKAKSKKVNLLDKEMYDQ